MDKTTPGEKPEPMISQSDFDLCLHHIAHDVRASFRAVETIPGWIESALEPHKDQIPSEVFQHLQMLETHARRADQLLIDLRDFALLGRDGATDTPVQVELACKNAVISARIPEQFSVETKIAVAELFVPQVDLEKLLVILISNAVKHHDKTTGNIHIQFAKDPVSIRVIDDGPGIEPEHRDKVFELLSTLQSRDQCEGSGVGLALAKKIVSSWGGTIRIKDPDHANDPGRGAEVEISLPDSVLTPRSAAQSPMQE